MDVTIDTMPAPQITGVANPEFGHLQPETAEMLRQGASVEERVTYALSDRWIGYTAAIEALKAIGDLLRLPRTTTTPSLLMLGRPGNGKTTILRRFVEMHPPSIRSTGDLTASIIHLSIPAGADESEFWTVLLLACGSPHRATDSKLVKMQQAYHVIDGLKPRMLVADELNNLLLGSGRAQRQLLGRVRELTNRFNLHLAFAATDEMSNAMRTDEQLDRRLPPYILPRWRHGKEARRLLSSYERVLPLRMPSMLSDERVAAEVLARSDGTIASIVGVIKNSAKLAIENGLDRIDLDVIRATRLDTREERQLRAKEL